MLHGRDRERERIDVLLDNARDSRGGALVLRGEPGIGKTTLLAHVLDHAQGMLLLRTQGIESEAPLAFAALQRLLRPAVRYVDRLPAPQKGALRAAFGETAGAPADRFLIFLAALSLLAEAAEENPVLCVIDDAHWLDDASAAALLFVARRLGPERVALLFASRDRDLHGFDSGDLPALTMTGLDAASATRLLTELTGENVSADVLDRLIVQTGGNPLALVELPTAMTPAQIRGEERLPAELSLTVGVQRVFLDRSRRLSAAAQTLLCVAAADDSTRAAVVRQAAGLLGADSAALTEAEDAGLIKIVGAEIQFRHPLVRSAVYQGAVTSQRRQAHAALARVMTGAADADRRAWHLAAAADEPDENVVAALDQAAARAQARGGYEAASAAFERAAELTRDEPDRATRLFAGARNAWLGAQLPRAMRLATDARAGITDPSVCADLDRFRGRIEFTIGSVSAAIRIWSRAARDVAATDPERAWEIGMIAVSGSTFLAGADRTDLHPDELLTPSTGRDSARSRCYTNLFIGFHHLNHDRPAAAANFLRQAISTGEDWDEPDLLINLGIAAFHIDDDQSFRRSFTRLLDQSRDSGAIGLVLFALPRMAIANLSAGNWAGAAANATEAVQLARSTGQPSLAAMPLAQLALYAALRGDDDYGSLMAELDRVTVVGPAGILSVLMQDFRVWARGSHDARIGRPAEALHTLGQMTQPTLTRLAAYDRLDTAVRAGDLATAARWLADLEQFAEAVDTPHARTVVAYGRALIASANNEPAVAETFFREAFEDPGLAGRPFELARTRLAYGEFLRRSRRRVDAREQLRSALQTFEDLGFAPWAQRAAQELRGSGETARKRDTNTPTTLTAQESQVASFVASGLSNRDVAAKLFLSPRTIDFHLRNVFAKTGITSRLELARLDIAAH